MTTDQIASLNDAIHAAGICPAEQVPMIADGRVHRFKREGDKARERSCWVKIFDNGDGTHGASFGDHHGNNGKWFSGRPHRELTAEEKRAYAQKMAEGRARLAAEEARHQRKAAEKAAHLWRKAQPADPGHDYLQKKNIQPHGLRQLAGSLAIPVRDSAGTLTSLQFIGADGSKRFLSAGRIKGCYWGCGSPPKPGEPLLIGEGVATTATLHEATGYAAAAAFSAGNLEPVALALREKFPQAKILVCADADPVGRETAAAAAAAVNGLWIEPDFQE